MAANKKQTKKADWKAEIGIDYAIYANEKAYISPSEVSKESLEKLKGLKQKLEKFSVTRQRLATKH